MRKMEEMKKGLQDRSQDDATRFGQEIERYLDRNYQGQVIQKNEEAETSWDEDRELLKMAPDLSPSELKSLDQVISEVGESFHETLFRYIDRSKMTDVEVYKRAGIDRKLFSKIRSNPAYHPRKATVCALIIALRLNMDEAVDLLQSAEYAFSNGSKSDLIVKYFIEHEIYDIYLLKETIGKLT